MNGHVPSYCATFYQINCWLLPLGISIFVCLRLLRGRKNRRKRLDPWYQESYRSNLESTVWQMRCDCSQLKFQWRWLKTLDDFQVVQQAWCKQHAFIWPNPEISDVSSTKTSYTTCSAIQPSYSTDLAIERATLVSVNIVKGLHTGSYAYIFNSRP